MVNFGEIFVFHSDSIICQKASVSTCHADADIYSVNIQLKNGDNIFFNISSEDWFSLLAYMSWQRGNIYIINTEEGLAKYFTSSTELKNFIKGEK
jgi:hypothetical protein